MEQIGQQLSALPQQHVDAVGFPVHLLLEVLGEQAVLPGQQYAAAHHLRGKADHQGIAAVLLQPGAPDGFKAVGGDHRRGHRQAVQPGGKQKIMSKGAVLGKRMTGQKDQVKSCRQFPKKENISI